MKCQDIENKLVDIVSGKLAPTELEDCRQHIAHCVACDEVMRGVEGLAQLRNRDPGTPPTGLFETVSARLERRADQNTAGKRFWTGTTFGGVVAASLFALALTVGWIQLPANAPDQAAPEFMVALSESRDLSVAIETEHALANATITVTLSGGVELAGYTGQRQLSWKADLVAGVNRLTLPVKATGIAGGQVIVQLAHLDSEQVLVVGVKADA
jgi:anti-sigma factor RsiW